MRHACPSCRTLLEIVHPTSEAVVCPECRTIAQAGHGTLVPLGKTGPFEPPLPLPIGATGRIDGGEWTLLGGWRLIEAGYFWDSFTLGSPSGELRYLGYDRHRFRWHEPAPWVPEFDRLVESQGARLRARGQGSGRTGDYIEGGSGKLVAAAGELPWSATPDEVTDYYVFERMTLEVTRGLDLREASVPLPVSHATLRAAFRLPFLWKRLDWTAKGGLRLRGPSVERVAATVAGVVAGGAVLVGGIGYAAYQSAHPGLDPSALDFSRGASTDSRGGGGWVSYRGPDACARAWGVAAADPWGPWQKRTLIAALEPIGEAARPLAEPDLQEERAARAVASGGWPERAAIVVDLPGPSSVAMGAGLAAAGRARPVLTFNNWPHQHGLVKCERTLAALLTFAGEVEEARRRLPADAPPALLLDRERLLRVSVSPTRVMDNRYGLVLSDLPSTREFAARGLGDLVYVAPGPPGAESDDLNAWFLSLASSGVSFRWATVAPDGTATFAAWRPAVRVVVAGPPPLPGGGGSTGGSGTHRSSGGSRGFFG